MKYLKMSQGQKRKEMNVVLKNMIRQKKEEKQHLKKLSLEEYQASNKEMYYPQGLEMF